jgi:serine/threonine protein kinase
MADRPNRIGQQLGNYRLIRLQGEGRFAEVYLGEHIYLKTQVAVKVLQEKIEAQYVEGFLKEAQTIAALKHPHILRVLDFGMENARPFLVMEYASGGTLRQKHPRGSKASDNGAAICP